MPNYAYSREYNRKYGDKIVKKREVTKKKAAPKKEVVYKYPGYGRKIGSFVGGTVGRGLAGPVGAMVGDALGQVVGHGAQSAMKSITGFGDYKVSGNSFVYGKDAVPRFSNNTRCTIISHREFLCDIVSSGNTFNLQQFLINPSNSRTFPWLSQIAPNYEEYVIQGLIFEFNSTSGSAISSSNASMGTVIMATQYNTYDSVFLSKQSMENYEFAVSIVPHENVIHPVECDPSLTPNRGIFYINNPNTTSTGLQDQRLYNLGTFSIATSGQQSGAAGTVLGELHVAYKICLLKPRLYNQIAGSDHWIIDPSTVDLSHPFGISPTLSTSSTSYVAMQITGVVSSQALTSTIYAAWNSAHGSFPDTCYINPGFTGNIMIVYQIQSSNIGMIGPTISFNSPLTLLSAPPYDAGFESVVQTYTAGDGSLLASWVLQCTGGFDSTGSAPYFSLDGYTYTGGDLSQVNLAIYTIPANLVN